MLNFLCQGLVGSIKQAGVIRQVCKAWLAAFYTYPAQLINTKAKELEKLVQIAPCMDTLLIEDPTEADMKLVARCTQLKAFHAWARCGIRSIDLSYLPRSVQLIQLESVYFKLSKLENLQCTRIIRAKLNCYSDTSDGVWRLVQLLPELQVLIQL